MYHVIEAPPPGAPYPELYLPADAFAKQMRYLAAHHFHAVTLQAVWPTRRNGATLPIHPIVLSFDDGYRSQFTNAARTLRRYHWPGVLNLIVSHLHAGTYGLGPHMVQAMIAAGWEIDSHTFNHPDLTTLPASTMLREVGQSRRTLRRLFDIPVNYFCYPAGRYNASVIATVRSAGYVAATTTNYGVAHPSQGRFTLDRSRVDGTDTAASLGQKLHRPPPRRVAAAAQSTAAPAIGWGKVRGWARRFEAHGGWASSFSRAWPRSSRSAAPRRP